MSSSVQQPGSNPENNADQGAGLGQPAGQDQQVGAAQERSDRDVSVVQDSDLDTGSVARDSGAEQERDLQERRGDDTRLTDRDERTHENDGDRERRASDDSRLDGDGRREGDDRREGDTAEGLPSSQRASERPTADDDETGASDQGDVEDEADRKRREEEFAREHDPANHDVAAGEEFRQRGDIISDDGRAKAVDAEGRYVDAGDASGLADGSATPAAGDDAQER